MRAAFAGLPAEEHVLNTLRQRAIPVLTALIDLLVRRVCDLLGEPAVREAVQDLVHVRTISLQRDVVALLLEDTLVLALDQHLAGLRDHRLEVPWAEGE